MTVWLRRISKGDDWHIVRDMPELINMHRGLARARACALSMRREEEVMFRQACDYSVVQRFTVLVTKDLFFFLPFFPAPGDRTAGVLT